MAATFPAGRLKAVLLDKDGTLLDFHATWAPILRKVALDLAEGDEVRAGALLAAGGYDPGTGRITPGSVLAAGNTRDLVALWYPDAGGRRRRSLIARIDEQFHAGAVSRSVPAQGLAGALDALAAAGLALGIATSDATAAARAAIGGLGFAHRFACILGYDSVRRPKPAPDMVMRFCRTVSVRPIEVVVVGDSRHDLMMARNAGAGAAVGVLGGTSEIGDLAPLADVVIDGIAELPACIEAFAAPRR